jgi:vesicle-fusing ATPase
MDLTFISWEKAPNATLKLAGAEGQVQTSIFKGDFNFEELGIGGLDAEFAEIFKRAFVPRIFPMSLIKKMNMRFVKGILLYGPPGTGKTLMARQMAKMLNSRTVQIVDGPSILNKYVGQSEENIRNLFKDAEAEQKSKGDESGLHVIIFDEIDAIAAQRGSRAGGSGVGDTVVNQLLAKLDGVEQLQNILVIGMTNRKDMIDEALLRPGRFEVHIEVNLPDEHGRLQIFQIHTKTHRDNKLLAADVNLEELAAKTKNYSGSEIKGLIDHASQIALSHKVDASNPTDILDANSVVVTHADFELALSKTKPQFGVSDETLDLCMANGIINYGPSFDKLIATGQMFVNQVANSDRTPLVSVLLEGPLGSGKTAIAAKLASTSGFPLVKLVSPDNTVGMNETVKSLFINRVFEDAYKSPMSLIIIDDLERLLDYVRIGPRFSNSVLQTIMVLLKKRPPKNRKLLIIATSSNRSVLEDMEILPLFDATVHMPSVQGAEVKPVLASSGYSEADVAAVEDIFQNIKVPIKQLIMMSEMAKQGSAGSLADRLRQCLMDYGYGGAGSKLNF